MVISEDQEERSLSGLLEAVEEGTEAGEVKQDTEGAGTEATETQQETAIENNSESDGESKPESDAESKQDSNHKMSFEEARRQYTDYEE